MLLLIGVANILLTREWPITNWVLEHNAFLVYFINFEGMWFWELGAVFFINAI